MVDTIKPHETHSVHFWSNYIRQRKPVILDGHLMDADWKASAKWDDAYLEKRAGDARVMVEQRDGPKGAYGQGKRVPMTFRDLLHHMRQGGDTFYLTTQQVGISKKDGHPELWAEPLSRLSDDFTPCPDLMGGLVPQQINMWMGCAKDGASSGLHHDYHDNLYVLLRGKKRFRLWAPSHARNMHTAGQIAHVHPNGRIVYKGQGDIAADGSSSSEVALWKACRSAEAAVHAAEQGVAQKKKGAKQELERAEERLEAALDAQLTHKLHSHGGKGGSKGEAQSKEGGEGESEDEGSMDLLDGLQDDYMDEDAADSSQEGNDSAGEGQEGVQQDEGDPPSFCTGVDLTMSDQQLKKAFPGFPGKSAALEVTLHAGQMLYLPAGWFHEVTSYSMPTEAPAGAPSACGHLAVNYWFHPPDNLEAKGAAGAARPYKSDYWPSLWRSRAADLGIHVPEPSNLQAPGGDRTAQEEMGSEDGSDEHEGSGDEGSDDEQGEGESNEGQEMGEDDSDEQGEEGSSEEEEMQQQQQQPAKRARKGQPQRLQPPPSKQQQQQQQQHEKQQPTKRARKGQPQKLQPPPSKQQQQQQQGQEDGSLLPGEEGDLGDMVAQEMHSYFQSPEGSGAFKSALGTYMLKAMLKEQLKGMQQRKEQQRRCLRSKGRRHHKCARSNPNREEEGA